MPPKPSASDIKKRVKAMQRIAEGVEPSAVLSALANHDAVVRMLGNKFADLGESGARALLGELTGLANDLANWADPSAKTASPAPSDEKPEPQSGSVSEYDDPVVLREFVQVKVNIDGASKGNPGPAAVGICISDVEGVPLYEEGRLIGRTTNNVAEYRALIHALEILVENGAPRAFFFSDSQLLVNQINGKWKIKNPDMRDLAMEAQRLRRRLAGFQIVHVRREQNRRADELANLAYKNR